MLAHEIDGSGPPLVLLHPLGADRTVWRPVLAHLRDRRECIAIDLPGFGQSDPLPGSASPAALAEAVLATLAALGLGPGHGRQADLAGNSLGGWVALEAALKGGAASVTAIAPAGLWTRVLPPKPEIARTLARAARPLLATAMRSRRIRRVALAGSMARPGDLSPAEAAALVRAYASASGFTAANRAMRGSTFTRLGEIEVPVTLVWPELDRLVARPRRLPPAVEEIVLRGCGHVPMWDDPAAVAAALLAGSVHPAEALAA